MSRWSILRSKLTGGDLNTKNNNVSIHRHEGFRLFKCKRDFWLWKVQEVWSPHPNDSNPIESLKLFYNYYMDVRDCVECCLSVKIPIEMMDEFHQFFQSGDDAHILRFEPFQVNHALQVVETIIYPTRQIDTSTLLFPECIFKQYFSSSLDEKMDSFQVYTREGVPDRKVKLKDICSHKEYQVDNTGNVRVWDSESVLLYTLLCDRGRCDSQLSSYIDGKRILELGGGLTALCGLGLAIYASINKNKHENDNNIKINRGPTLVVLTDGHTKCARNLQVCVEMNRQKGLLKEKNSEVRQKIDQGCEVYTQRLRWDRYDPECARELSEACHCALKIAASSSSPKSMSISASASASMPKPISVFTSLEDSSFGFDTVLVSDCLFFEDFHVDLLWVLRRSVIPGGRALLLQPTRSESMYRFLHLVNKEKQPDGQPIWHVDMSRRENYCAEVWSRHEAFMQAEHKEEGDGESNDNTIIPRHYDPDIHFPQLVILTKLEDVQMETLRQNKRWVSDIK